MSSVRGKAVAVVDDYGGIKYQFSITKMIETSATASAFRTGTFLPRAALMRIEMITMRKVWSVEEANRTLPYLREILSVLMEQCKRADLAREALVEWNERVQSNGNGTSAEMQRRNARLRDAVSQVRQGLEQVRSMGCEVKDLEVGLVDFPGQLNGRDVLLCWQINEPAVLYWHDPDKGFMDRQPL